MIVDRNVSIIRALHKGVFLLIWLIRYECVIKNSFFHNQIIFCG